METRLESLATELSFLRDNHHKLKEKVSVGEKTLATLQLLAADNQTAIQDLQERASYLQDRVEDTGTAYRGAAYGSWAYQKVLKVEIPTVPGGLIQIIYLTIRSHPLLTG
ncbi:hypothetical protein NDU88_005220 [Pleurodeles waltl]|uniref:Uncharacterized protein n=1 Tax=Pleurodeles waltl TaxID=8319 RepID=A0AAV7QEM8_PLEWA|nr:hypothetical protein NDU88_005220 [Pleurodeles waltl]